MGIIALEKHIDEEDHQVEDGVLLVVDLKEVVVERIVEEVEGSVR